MTEYKLDGRQTRCQLCNAWVLWGQFYGIQMALDLDPTEAGIYYLVGLSSAIQADPARPPTRAHHTRHRCRPVERTLT